MRQDGDMLVHGADDALGLRRARKIELVAYRSDDDIESGEYLVR